MNYQELDPSVEIAQTRRLLGIQPGCLLRLDKGGVVLAANDAAPALLGVESAQQALGRTFTTWLSPEVGERWDAFAARVIGGTPASFECDIVDASGVRHTTLFHGAPLIHPDGLPSMVVSARAL